MIRSAPLISRRYFLACIFSWFYSSNLTLNSAHFIFASSMFCTANLRKSPNSPLVITIDSSCGLLPRKACFTTLAKPLYFRFSILFPLQKFTTKRCFSILLGRNHQSYVLGARYTSTRQTNDA